MPTPAERADRAAELMRRGVQMRKGAVLEMHDQGESHRSIGRAVGITHRTVSRIIETADADMGAMVSVGYEGRTIDELVGALRDLDVTLLVDVRLTPISRKPGFSKSALASSLEAHGICYEHEPALGNPADNRDSFRLGDGARGRKRYLDRLDNGSGPALEQLFERVRYERIAILCVEREQSSCHRSCIVQRAQERFPALTVLAI